MRIRQKNRFRSRAKHVSDLSMTPLIDVALTLLIMFMVATPILQNAIKVTLPRGQAQEDAKNQSQELVVYIDKAGDYYIDTLKIERPNLIAHLKKTIGEDLEKTVYVKADTAVSYGTVLELVDDINNIKE